jgi:hypothetical protein
MNSDYARQTRWASPPDPANPAQDGPDTPYARQIVWLPCTDCDLQVHALLTQLLTEGVACPECGARLAAPGARHAADPIVTEALCTEERFRRQLENEETECCD